MDGLLQQALSGIIASGPVASVLLVMWYYQRKDAREEAGRAANLFRVEQDRHAAEEDKWRTLYLTMVEKVVSAIRGDHP